MPRLVCNLELLKQIPSHGGDDMAKNNTQSETTGFIRLRPRIVMSLAVVMALGFFGHKLWQRYEPTVSRHPQYAITAERIVLPERPPWIQHDFRAEVLRDAGLVGELSLLDGGDTLARIKQAFEYHPWIESVGTVSKQLPAGIYVKAVYRQPVATVQTASDREMTLLPVDRNGIRLPENDLPMNQRVHLPRITGVTGRPSIGQIWSDPRVVSGVRLAAALTDAWHALRLVEIVPVPSVKSSGSFEIRTRGGTRIVWGAAPGEELGGESSFGEKLQRLQNYASQNRNLHTIDGPKSLDVRRDLRIQPRTAQEKKLLAAKMEKEKQATTKIASRKDDKNQTK